MEETARTVEEVQRALAQVASEPPAKERLNIVNLLRLALERSASDLHLAVGAPPVFRIDGSLARSEFATLTREESKRLVYSLLTDNQKTQFERDQELDFSIAIKDLGRFRVNVHYQRGSVEAAIRVVPPAVRSLEALGLPPEVADLARKPHGLILVTGPTGQGKTTTLASMIELINAERAAMIIVIEDPIEYVFKHNRSIVKQREVLADTKSFAEALRHSLRQDPNVIVVGEMRDLETISTALTAAETGHLVLATLHTPDAPQTIDRIIDVFPPHQQQQVKIQLADCLQGVISQQLLPRADSFDAAQDRPFDSAHLVPSALGARQGKRASGRVLAYEIMVATSAVRALIRDHATSQLPTVIQTGGQYGMCTMDSCLKRLCQQGLITYEIAISHARFPKDFADLKP